VSGKGEAGLLERLLARERLLVGGALTAVCLIAAAYTVAGVGMDMSALTMTAMSSMRDMPGGREAGAWTPAYATLVFFMWWIMMIAMMLPSAAPTILLHAALARTGKAAGSVPSQSAAFAGGYLATWAGFSLFAASLQWGLEAAGFVSATMMTLTARGLAGGLLVAAGLYQFTPLKNACLTHCRSPAQFLVEHRRPGIAGAFRIGLAHGAYCAGCCVALMALLFAGGIMNLWWIAGIALMVAVEKLAPAGQRIGRVLGAVLIGAGLWLIAASVAAGV
jgi:predicted metal-binding membrane protein